MNFKHEYMQIWTVDSLFDVYYEEWFEYHLNYERYDRYEYHTRPYRPIMRRIEDKETYHRAKLAAVRDVERMFPEIVPARRY